MLRVARGSVSPGVGVSPGIGVRPGVGVRPRPFWGLTPVSRLFTAALLAWSASAACAWPDRPVRVIVPLAPGGGTDIVARLFTPRFSADFGQQFIVDNRAGAGGTVGAEIA